METIRDCDTNNYKSVKVLTNTGSTSYERYNMCFFMSIQQFFNYCTSASKEYKNITAYDIIEKVGFPLNKMFDTDKHKNFGDKISSIYKINIYIYSLVLHVGPCSGGIYKAPYDYLLTKFTNDDSIYKIAILHHGLHYELITSRTFVTEPLRLVESSNLLFKCYYFYDIYNSPKPIEEANDNGEQSDKGKKGEQSDKGDKGDKVSLDDYPFVLISYKNELNDVNKIIYSYTSCINFFNNNDKEFNEINKKISSLKKMCNTIKELESTCETIRSNKNIERNSLEKACKLFKEYFQYDTCNIET